MGREQSIAWKGKKILVEKLPSPRDGTFLDYFNRKVKIVTKKLCEVAIMLEEACPRRM